MRAKYCSTFFFSRAISVLDEFVWSAGYVSGCAARRSRLGLAGCCCGKATPHASCCESAIAAASCFAASCWFRGEVIVVVRAGPVVQQYAARTAHAEPEP